MIWSKRNILFPSASADTLILWLLRIASGMAAGLVLLILFFLLAESLPLLREVQTVRFITDTSWHPVEGAYNLAPMLSGTALRRRRGVILGHTAWYSLCVICCLLCPTPAGGIYLRLVELLAGIPSVVYGFWALTTLVPLINELHPPGASLLAGILVLTLMILPTVALTAHAALLAVPDEYLRSAAALGMSRWSIIRGVVLPAARMGVTAGIILAAGRAIGETMAVLMVTGNVVQRASTVYDPIRTLAANIALEMPYALGDHRAALFVSGLVLMLLVIALWSAAARIGRN